MKTRISLAAAGSAALLVVALASAPALAAPPGERGGEGGGAAHGQGPDKGRQAERAPAPSRAPSGDQAPKGKAHKADKPARAGKDFRFDSQHRDVVRRYEERHHYRCPRGLVATRNGCLPRGQAKKRYVVGQPLPRGVVIEVLPRALVAELPPPPAGYIYRRVDGDVLLIAEGTRRVMDALVLFSAVGR